MRVSASRTRSVLALGLLGALLVVGCAGTANTVTGATTTDVFTGTLLASGTNTYPVTVAGNGELDLTLTSLTPQTTITVGLGIGVSQGTCGLINAAENAKAGGVLPASVTPGAYCVVIYDVGNVQGSDGFTLTVVHP